MKNISTKRIMCMALILIFILSSIGILYMNNMITNGNGVVFADEDEDNAKPDSDSHSNTNTNETNPGSDSNNTDNTDQKPTKTPHNDTKTEPEPAPKPSVTISNNPGSIRVNQKVSLSTKTSNVSGGHTVSWSSSNTAVATVDSTGLVTGISEGSVSITASVGDQASSVVNITVTGLPLESIKIKTDSIGIGNTKVKVGESLYLNIEATPSGASIENVIWTSDNEEIGTIDETGEFVAIKKGEVNITASVTEDGAVISDSINLTVVNKSFISPFLLAGMILLLIIVILLIILLIRKKIKKKKAAIKEPARDNVVEAVSEPVESKEKKKKERLMTEETIIFDTKDYSQADILDRSTDENQVIANRSDKHKKK